MAKDFIPSTHPLTPPLTEEEWLHWLRLLRSRRVGISTFFRLLGEHETAEAALAALPGVAAEAGIEDYEPASRDDALREWEAARMAGVTPIAHGSAEYPPALMDIPDPPPILWALGDTTLLQAPTLAIVGARNASSLGTRTARKLATDLGSHGFTISSGLARGVDTVAHIASLDTGTIAVMAGCGRRVSYGERCSCAGNPGKRPKDQRDADPSTSTRPPFPAPQSPRVRSRASHHRH